MNADRYGPWRDRLGATERAKLPKHEAALATDQVPIHPLRLCKEIRDFIGRDTILCVDGQEILNYGRQSIPSYRPGHRLNSGPFGTMVLATGLGLASVVHAEPRLHAVLKYAGAAYLLYLAWRIARADPASASARARPIGFLEAILFTWMNPKAWVSALGAVLLNLILALNHRPGRYLGV